LIARGEGAYFLLQKSFQIRSSLCAPQDASEEFNMLHNPNVLEKYMEASACLGPLGPAAKL